MLTLPMAEALRRHDAAARITFVVQEYTSSLVALCPFVDDVISIPARDLTGGIQTFARTLRAQRFDAAFFAYPRPRLAFAARLAGIPIRAGIAYRWYSFLFTHRRKEHRHPSLLHERDYNLRLLRNAGIEAGEALLPQLLIPDALREEARHELASAGIEEGQRFVVLHPGSGGSAKDWPPERFAELAQMLGKDEDLISIVTGTPSERKLQERVVAQSAGYARPISSSLSLVQLAAVLSGAALCVANSTGPLHLAAAVGTPVLGLYPFERVCHPRRWGPLGHHVRVLTPPLAEDCTDCASSSCPQHDDMLRIEASDAAEAAQDLLAGQG